MRLCLGIFRRIPLVKCQRGASFPLWTVTGEGCASTLLTTMGLSSSRLPPGSSTKTRIRELLRSNAEPPAGLASTISAVAEQLAWFDDEIAELRAELDELEAQHANLETYHDDCHGLMAPIRRLPCETLVEIFGFWRQFVDDKEFGERKRAMHRLAHAPLLVVAQVCSRWHCIAMNTPTLWDTIELKGTLWTTANRPHERAMDLLRLVLERSQSTPLHLKTFGEIHPAAIELLAQHSDRWKTAQFLFPPSNVKSWSSVKGILPSLESLELNTWGILDFFVAPRLRSLVVHRAVCDIPIPLIQQLHTLGCVVMRPTEIPMAMLMMECLSFEAQCRLQFHFSHWREGLPDPIKVEVPCAVSHVKSLAIEVVGYVDPYHCIPALDVILTHFTLPHLHHLSFRSTRSSRFPLLWRHAEFADLSERSSFQTHLLSLDLRHVMVGASDLLECLAALPLLEHLGIADQVGIPERHVVHGGGVKQLTLHLITDTLVAALAQHPHSPCLVPRLRVLDVHSFLKFDDHFYLYFLLSRLQAGHCFENNIRWLAGSRRDLDPIVAARIDELRTQGRLAFSFESYQPNARK
ncbi:hypothetical protein C8R44DRAFT_752288 [Mycena epipterygia]|nr:hypothetical protein C8R44DRAFT_752288 [Mycena epipterygia]